MTIHPIAVSIVQSQSFIVPRRWILTLAILERAKLSSQLISIHAECIHIKCCTEIHGSMRMYRGDSGDLLTFSGINMRSTRFRVRCLCSNGLAWNLAQTAARFPSQSDANFNRFGRKFTLASVYYQHVIMRQADDDANSSVVKPKHHCREKLQQQHHVQKGADRTKNGGKPCRKLDGNVTFLFVSCINVRRLRQIFVGRW